jgi:O-antigen/teichoic acid export membrane protein
MVFSVNFLFMYPNMLFSNFLISMGKQRQVLMFMVLMATANVTINFYVIPRYGVLGAALTTMLSEVIFFILASVQLVRRGGVGIDPIPAFKMLLTGGVCLAVSKVSPVAWWLKSAIIIALFITVTQLIRAYDYRKLLLLLNRSAEEL